jgi:DNA-binding NarL/FixJ family response regulator
VRLRVLIADDNEDFLDSVSRVLEDQGLDVVGRVTSGSAAIRAAAVLRPDVVLLDVMLGQEDGFDVARRLAATDPAVPVVLISTYPEDDLAEGLADSSAVGFLPKRALSAEAIAALVR